MSAPASAFAVENTETTDGLSVVQEKEQITQDLDQQSYTFSYQGYDTTEYAGGTFFSVNLPEGFKVDSLCAGDWDYEGKVYIKAYSKSTELLRLEAEENSTVELNEYDGIVRLELRTDDNLIPLNFTGIKLSGTVDTQLSADFISVTGNYYGDNGTSGNAETFASTQIQTYCRYFNPETPQIALSTGSLGYQDAINATVTGLGGNGNTDCNNFQVNIHIPQRMHIEKVILPEFDNAQCALYIGDTEQPSSNGEVLVDAAAENMILKITPGSGSFTQTKEMSITMINSVNSAGTEAMSVTATSTLLDKYPAQSYASADILFNETVIDPDPEEPENPETPEIPEEPEEKPGSGNDENDSGNSGIIETPDPGEGTNPPVDTVIDYTGMNLQSAVAVSGNTTYDFTSGTSRTAQSRSSSENSLYESVVDDNIVSKESKKSDSKDTTLEEDIEKEAEQQEKITSIFENDAVRLGGIAAAVVVAGALAIYFVFRKPKKDSKNKSEK